jgi:prevent-host-death family protein
VKTVNIYEAKTRLSQLVDQAASGDDVVVSRNGRPLARLTRLEPSTRKVRFGVLKGRITVPDDFDKPLPPSVRRVFEGG